MTYFVLINRGGEFLQRCGPFTKFGLLAALKKSLPMRDAIGIIEG